MLVILVYTKFQLEEFTWSQVNCRREGLEEKNSSMNNGIFSYKQGTSEISEEELPYPLIIIKLLLKKLEGCIGEIY
jgi:hypothetical protein